MRACFLFLMPFLASCAASPVGTDDDGKTEFTSSVNKTWVIGVGGSSIAPSALGVQNSGKKIILYAVENGTNCIYTFIYDSQVDAQQAYYRNTIGPASGVIITRYVGLKIDRGNLIWVGHNPSPTLADFPNSMAPQFFWDTFNAKWWAKNKVDFNSSYAVIGS